MLLTILLFIVILGLLVFVHEFGHFIAAKRAGVAVSEFGFGFPPRIFGVKYKGTLYSVNWIPLGGFVKIKGVAGEEENPEAYADADSFAQKKYWQKALILSAGVLMNLLLAAVLMGVGYMIGFPSAIDESVLASGATVRDQAVQVVQVQPDTPAADAGLQVGDKLVALDGTVVSSVEQVQDYNADRVGETVEVSIERDGAVQRHAIAVVPFGEDQRGILGVALAATGLVSYPWYHALWLGLTTTASLLVAILVAFYELLRNLFVSGEVAAELAGPVGIAVLTGEVARLGFVYILQFAAILSINLAIFNILPIPALDGGRLLFTTIERIRGKQNSERFEGTAHRLGFALLIVLVVLVTFRDIGRHSEAILNFFRQLF